MAARSSRSDVSQADAAAKDGSPAEAASFISESVMELSQLSRRHGLDILTHLLEMAELEASDAARRQTKPGKF